MLIFSMSRFSDSIDLIFIIHLFSHPKLWHYWLHIKQLHIGILLSEIIWLVLLQAAWFSDHIKCYYVNQLNVRRKMAKTFVLL